MNLQQRLRLAGILLAFVVVVAVLGYVTLGRSSLLDAIYMAIITVAGVGYGEIVPTQHNPALRVFNMFVVVIGVTVTVYVFSVVTAFLVEGEINNLFWRRKMQKRISDLTEHFIICGLGDTGRYAVEEMHRTRTPYVVIESHEDIIKKFHEHHNVPSDELLYVIGDATDETVLDEAGIERAKGLISALASDKDNLVTSLMARQKNAKLRIVSRCVDIKYADRMMKAGANSTVSPNRIGGMRLASEALRPHVVSFLDLMLKEHSKTLRIEEIEVPEGSSWVGSELRTVDLRNRFNVLVLATKSSDGSEEGHFRPIPHEDELVKAGSVIIVMGDVTDVRHARNDALHGRRHTAQ